MIVLKWSMMQLQKFRNKGLTFNEMVNLESLKNRDPQIRTISPIQVFGTAEIDSKKVTFHLHIKGELVLPSTRTLEDVQFPIDIQSTEIFMYETAEYNEDSELNLHIIHGEIIDLTPVIEELILVEIPMQVYNEEEDVSSLFSSGRDWEFIQEADQEKQEKIDPRFAELAKLFNQKNSNK
ncbi:DUF177 domain-containing protein [Caldifermentibacillus hisashii]|uniref:YceD family protein n=1 Tax=Caldifermentibacillus hisashii TaxID=996558 RepID=UPI0034D656B5